MKNHIDNEKLQNWALSQLQKKTAEAIQNAGEFITDPREHWGWCTRTAGKCSALTTSHSGKTSAVRTMRGIEARGRSKIKQNNQ